MEWLKKHADTATVIGAIVGSMLWMNSQFNLIDRRFSELEKDLAIIKTVLVMKNIMPAEFARNEAEKQ